MEHNNMSIIIPAYQAEDYLRDALDSLLAQTYKAWDCLILNNGSTDRTGEIARSYAKNDNRFHVYELAQNTGSAESGRRYLLNLAKTEYVINIDADDAVAPDLLEKLVNRLQETGADIIMGRRIGCLHELAGEMWRLPLNSFDMNQIISGREACLLTLGGWQIGGASLHRKSLDDGLEAGPYMNSCEFLDRKRLLRANKVAFADASYYVRRNIGTSDKISVRMFERTLVDMQLEQFVYDQFPEREDKIKALAWQRLFNLVYLCADYKIHEQEFTKEEREHSLSILRRSYKALNKLNTIKYNPVHALLLLSVSFEWFMQKSKWYVQYKRSHGGTFFYQ